MSNKNYIKIPTIKSLKVVNYPLFDYQKQDHWIFSVKDGINLMLGANSIGKTTTMNMIKFAFVGNQKEINIGYFSDRLTPAQKRTKNQAIVLEFILDGQLIEIHRNLQSGELNRFKIDNLVKPTFEYTDFLTENTKIPFSKWIDLLELMLIRVEEGNYILWDKEAQTKIISALLNDVEFQKEFSQDEENHEKLEKDYKSRLHLLIDKQNRAAALKKVIREEQDKQTQAKSLEAILTELEKFNAQKSLLIKAIEEFQQKRDAQKEQLKTGYEAYETLRVKFRSLEFQLQHAEIELKWLKEKIADTAVDPNCILCKTSLLEEKAVKIHRLYYIDRICPVCESLLGEKAQEEDTQTLQNRFRLKQEEVRLLKASFFKVKSEYETVTHERNNSDKGITILRISIETKEKELYSLNVKILDLENTIDLLKQKNVSQPTNNDVALLKLNQEIIDLKYELKKEEDKKKANAVKLSKQRVERNNIIKGFYEKLNLIFKKYSQEYFVENCELTFFNPSTHKGITQLSNFAPKFRDIERTSQKSVSHSEAVFLEYLFRVSLLELYFDEAGVKPFLFLETSEGVFDVANTESAATLFSKFAADKFPVIIISNLSKEKEFIDVLFNTSKEKNERLFNLIRFGNLTARQQQNKQLEFYFSS